SSSGLLATSRPRPATAHPQRRYGPRHHLGDGGTVTTALTTSEELAARCRADPEFRLACRYWDGGFRLVVGDDELAVRLVGGEPSAGGVGDGPGVVTLAGERPVWDALLEAVPPRFFNDVAFALGRGLERRGDELAYWQYYP